MTRQMTARREVLLIVLLTLLAAALRLWNLGDVPPGLFGDEAFNGLDAWRVTLAADGWHPIFFEANGGREPLFIYLVSVALWLLGPTAGALRLAPALLGTLTTPALYALGRALYGWRAGLLAALAWTVTFAAIAVSRVAFRAVALPLLATLTLWLLLAFRHLTGSTRTPLPRREGLGEGRMLGAGFPLSLAGLTLGLTLYTYIPGRIFPLVVALFAAHWGLTHRASWRRLVVGLTVMALVAALVFAPLGAYFLATPAAFTSRAADISVFALPDPLQGLIQSTGDRLSMLVWHGDVDPVRNLPGLPVLDPWLALCALAGLVICLRRPWDPTRALPLVWAMVLFAPALLVKGPADVLHVVGMLPALFLLVGLGAATTWTWVERRLSPARKWMPAAAIVTLFAISGVASAWHYFVNWAGDPAVAIAYHAPLVDLADAANERVARGEGVLLPRSVYGHPTVAYLTLRTCPRVGGIPPEGLRLPVDSAFLVPSNYDDEATFVLLSTPAARFLVPLGSPTIRRLREASGTPVPGRRGETIAKAVPADCQFVDSWPTDWRVLATIFGDQITLSGYDLGRSDTQRPRATPGEDVTLTVYWKAKRVPDNDYRTFVHLLDDQGRVRGGWDGAPVAEVFPTGAWRLGELIPAVYHVPVDANTPPGKYELEIGLYHLFTGKRLNAVAANGASLGSRALLGPLKVSTDNTAPGAPPTSLAQANLGGLVELAGFDAPLALQTLKPGQTISVALHWHCLALMDADYTVFVHLTDDAGHPVAQHDGQPRAGRYPTSIWDVGEVVLDEHEFAVPPSAVPGTYRLVAGLYDPISWARLPVLDDAGQPTRDHVLLETITVQP